jgi:hypothetical protein
MTKYNIEGGIDFYSELFKSLDNEIDDDDTNMCLISNTPLVDKFVTMSCGHKFNYIPLYNDLINHKNKFNGMESSHGKLSVNQIRCPYCRKKQNCLLPYYEELGLKQVHGVNFIDQNYKPQKTHNNVYNSCQYKFPNQNYDPNKPESESNTKYLPNHCHFYASKIQIYNENNPNEPITFGDDNYYCYSHKKVMIKQYKALEKVKAKEASKAAKLKAKEDAKLAKEIEKQKCKEEKQKAKEDSKLSKKKLHENIVIGPSNVLIENNNGCISILKSGPNKGKSCGCSIKFENMCSRHFKLTHNIIINN